MQVHSSVCNTILQCIFNILGLGFFFLNRWRVLRQGWEVLTENIVFSCVGSFVPPQMVWCSVWRVTYVTVVFLSSVCRSMLLQLTHRHKSFLTLVTLVWPLSSVGASHVDLQAVDVEHLFGASSEWVILCVFKLLDIVEEYSHWSHWYGFSPEWILMCLFISLEVIDE